MQSALVPSSAAQWAAAIATTIAAFIALFGEWMRANFFRPRLGLSLVKPRGEFIVQTLASGGKQQARYYHVRVNSARRWPVATMVQVHLIRLEEPLPNGEFEITWASGVPIAWQHQPIYPLQRTIGPAANIDLCSVNENGSLSLYPMLIPNNLKVFYTGRMYIKVSLQARGNEADSPIQRYRISWDGQWDPGETETAKHLVIAPD